MKKLFYISVLFYVFALSAVADAKTCIKYCNPEVSRPCGDGCISKDLNCKKSWTRACVGINPNKGSGRAYSPAEVKHVEAVQGK